MKVLTCGAGPTGLTAWADLARRGIEVAVFEARDAPSPLSRAVGVNPESLHRLEPSGVTEVLLTEDLTYTGLILHRGDRVWTRLDFAAARPERFGRRHMFGLPQDRTEATLAMALERHCGTLRRPRTPRRPHHAEGWAGGARRLARRRRRHAQPRARSGGIGYPEHRPPDA